MDNHLALTPRSTAERSREAVPPVPLLRPPAPGENKSAGDTPAVLRDALIRQRTRADMLAREVATLTARLSEAEALLRQAHSEARIDTLTGLPNRRALDEAFAREFARSQRQGNSLAVAVLDLDHFKQINDTHGHASGDAALVAFGAVIRQALRPSDTLYRLGGEEFVLLLPGSTAGAAARVLARLQLVLKQHDIALIGTQGYRIRFSAGLTVCGPADTTTDVLQRCDSGLYRAKQGGRDRCCCV